ncbi:MAG: hypothetical protein A2Y82_02655 [Candidatus Buchananbacteria bacterium RBG_13_36_9]|uniref:Uncharacterized protein n=1 Tax=Candidatus Buchananbacteria bacterium RBG_13_36_9 TaxID=1797530 RepID=A0A1G1XNR0_9BACT|nr:MAG: hypothetical protein A2Y82_02655 [Candidatus Buchananbacteria bacterium RBG_13_36_9]
MVKKGKKEITIDEVLSKFNYIRKPKKPKKIKAISLKEELKNIKKVVRKVKIVRGVKKVREYDFNDKCTHTIHFIEIEITLFSGNDLEKYSEQINAAIEFFKKITVLGKFFQTEHIVSEAGHARIIREDSKRFGEGAKIFKYSFVPLKVLKIPFQIKFYVII